MRLLRRNSENLLSQIDNIGAGLAANSANALLVMKRSEGLERRRVHSAGHYLRRVSASIKVQFPLGYAASAEYAGKVVHVLTASGDVLQRADHGGGRPHEETVRGKSAMAVAKSGSDLEVRKEIHRVQADNRVVSTGRCATQLSDVGAIDIPAREVREHLGDIRKQAGREDTRH